MPDGADLTVADVAITVAEVRSAGRPLRTTGTLTIDGTATSALGAVDIPGTARYRDGASGHRVDDGDRGRGARRQRGQAGDAAP